MPEEILDLHLHSKYSRACSNRLELPNIATACAVRGVTIATTGDFTHPAWFSHIEKMLVETGKDTGLYRLADATSPTRFVIGTEVASIKKHVGATRRVHHLLFAPNLDVARRFNKALENRGINIKSDGRPIIGMNSKDLLSLMLDVDERMVMIPAHAWTPWFGIFGSKGGYTTMEDAFEELSPRIFAIETGLSSDPLMNARVSRLDHIALISNSDAHSLEKIGREANVLSFPANVPITYDRIMNAFRNQHPDEFLYTIEFYPEEGKYHLDGHRDCGVVTTPEETKTFGGRCPKCGRPLVIGVMSRVVELADRTENDARSVRKIPHKSLVPLTEILAHVLGVGVASKRVKEMYTHLTNRLGSEFFILLHATAADIAEASDTRVAEAIGRVQRGEVSITPGYDGVFGVVKIVGDGRKRSGEQTGLVFD